MPIITRNTVKCCHAQGSTFHGYKLHVGDLFGRDSQGWFVTSGNIGPDGRAVVMRCYTADNVRRWNTHPEYHTMPSGMVTEIGELIDAGRDMRRKLGIHGVGSDIRIQDVYHPDLGWKVTAQEDSTPCPMCGDGYRKTAYSFSQA